MTNLEKSLKDFNFLLTGMELREYGIVEFSTTEEARKFRSKYVSLKCVSGFSYSSQELDQIYNKVKQLAKKDWIQSRELPFLKLKAENETIDDVQYIIEGNCFKIKKNCA